MKSADRTRPPQRALEVLAWLESQGSEAESEGMARYGIPSETAFGVSVGALQKHARKLGRDHDLAGALWETGRYEARMLACFVDEPAAVTAAQMDRWCRDFDSWAICDTACFHLFDRTPHAWRKVDQWSRRRGELARRAAFALLACLALHDKATGDEPFLRRLALVEKAATDGRNFVKKGVLWALRAIGERNAELRGAASSLAERLAESSDATARWVGKGAHKKLSNR